MDIDKIKEENVIYHTNHSTQFYCVGEYRNYPNLKYIDKIINKIKSHKIRHIIKLIDGIIVIVFDNDKMYSCSKSNSSSIGNYILITENHKYFLKIPCDYVKKLKPKKLML